MAENSNNVELRRRGRPIGKNRMPLSLDQRRARNALYERQRRQETSEAMAALAEAAGCDPTLNNADLLATVIKKLKGAVNTSNVVSDMKYINAKLMEQIETLEQRINDANIANAASAKNKKRKINKERKTKSSTALTESMSL